MGRVMYYVFKIWITTVLFSPALVVLLAPILNIEMRSKWDFIWAAMPIVALVSMIIVIPFTLIAWLLKVYMPGPNLFKFTLSATGIALIYLVTCDMTFTLTDNTSAGFFISCSSVTVFGIWRHHSRSITRQFEFDPVEMTKKS